MYTNINESPSQFLERRIAILFGLRSNALKALDLVREEMCIEKGFKRNNGTDFYNHCIDVANNLISFGIIDENVICAALLHDIIEDVQSYDDRVITRLFNSEVARLVMLVTKTPGKDYKCPENILAYLENISTDMHASAIKTSDRMHNMMTLEEKGFDSRYRKAKETQEYYLPFFRKCSQLYPRYENLFYAALAQMEPLIFHITSFYDELKDIKDKFALAQIEINKLKEKQ